MADNTTLNAGSGGDTYGSDDIAGVKYQRIKIIHGDDGTNDGDTSDANPLPIYAPSAILASQSGNWTVYAITQPLPVGTNNIGNVGLLDEEDGRFEGANTTPVGTENGLIVRNIPSGTQTVDTELPAASSLGDATSNPSVPAVGSFGMVWNGTSWDRMPGTAAAGATVTVANPSSQTDNSAYTAGTDGGVPMQGFYQSTPTTVTTGNVGTVGMTTNRELKVSLTTAIPAGSNLIGKVYTVGVVGEDDPLGPTTNPGIPIVAYATSTTKSAVSADGDAVHVAADRSGQLMTVSKLYSSAGAALPVGGGVEATALRVTIASDSTGVVSIDDNGGAITVDGTVAVSSITTAVVPGTGATNLGKAIDTAAGGTDTGVGVLAIRDDALGTLTPSEGDWNALRVDSTGALWVNVTNVNSQTDDAAFTAATSTGVGFMAAATTDAVDSGDFGVVAMTTSRELHVVNRPAAAGTSNKHYVSDGAADDAEVVKASAGVLSFVHATNNLTTEAYLKFYNKATAPDVSTDTPVCVAIIPPNDSGVILNPNIPIEFSTGIGFVIVGGAANTDSTAVGAAQVVVYCQYK